MLQKSRTKGSGEGAKEALSSHLKEAKVPPRPTLRASAMDRADYPFKYHTSQGISILFPGASRPASIVATLLTHRILAFKAEHVTIPFVSGMETMGELLERKDGV